MSLYTNEKKMVDFFTLNYLFRTKKKKKTKNEKKKKKKK